MRNKTKEMTDTTKQPSSSNRARFQDILHVLKKYHITTGMSPTKLRHILEDLGPTYVKLGQIMSMRSDMLPDNYCKELTKLRTSVKPIPFSEVTTILEEEWNCPLSQVLQKIDETPIGSASIAQVHHAILQTKEEVVIKVQRPHIQKTMKEDIELLKKAVKLLHLTVGTGETIDFPTILDELWKTSQEEMNFLKEAQHLTRFYQNQADIVYITSPKVFPNWTTKKVLVMEYIHGIQIDHQEELLKLGYDMEEIGRKTAENYCKQILEDGFFHADPHPGNLWISDGKIAWLDLGMTGTLSEYHKQLLKKAVMALLKNDMYELKNVFLAFGEPKAPINHARLYSDIDEIVQRYMSIGFGNMDLGKLMERLLSLVKVHKIAIHTDLTILCRSMVTLEGTLRICSPTVNMMEVLSVHMSQQFFQSFSLKNELTHKARLLYGSMDKSLEIPALFADLLNITKNGQTKLNLEFADLQEQRKSLQHITRQIILCFLACFLFLGSCILCLSDLEPQLFSMPWISSLGFLLSFLLMIWLIFITPHRK